MLKYLYSVFSNEKEKRCIDEKMYNILTKKQQLTLHKKYDIIIITRKT